MNPWDIVAWVGAIASALVIAVIAIAVIFAVIHGIKNPTPRKTRTSFIQGGDRS